MKKHIANLITLCRILCSILLLALPAYSIGFYAAYLVCGFSDMIDGTVARKTHSVSKFGQQLDTIADILFLAAASVKLLPLLRLPAWLWVWAAGIAVVKLSRILRNFLLRRPFLPPHTRLNKLTGLLLFLLPLTLPLLPPAYTVPVVCAAATAAAIQEWQREPIP